MLAGLPDDQRLLEVQAAALASISDAVMITDVDAVIVWVNDAFTTMSGYTFDEAVGNTPRLLKSGVQDEGYYRRLWETILAGRRWRAEVVERHKDGHHYRVMQTITPVCDDGGQVRYFVATHENVTELRASQARLQALFDHARDGILLYDDQGRLVDANPAITALSGYTAGQLTRMTMADVVPGHFLAQYEVYSQQLREQGATRGDAPFVCSDGQVVEVEFQSVADIVPGVHLSVVRDVTDQRRLQSLERFQAQLLEAVGEAVIATDLEGTVRYWNPAAERLYGWPAADVVGHNIVELNVAEGTEQQAEQKLTNVRAGESWTGQYLARRAGGTRVPVWVTDAPYYDTEGRLAGIIGVSSDISELEQARARLAERARQQAVVGELGRFALHSDDPHAVGAAAQRHINEMLGPDVQARVHWSHLPAVPGEQAGSEVLRVPIAAVGELVVWAASHDALDAEDEEFLRAVANVVAASVRHQAAAAELAHLATHDPLTGLPNRTLFTDRLEQTRAAAARTGRAYAVLFLDLDGFKTVNDGLGHDTGDEILRQTTVRLREVVRLADTVARFGGDEFAVLCPDLDHPDVATEVAQRVQTALATAFDTDHGQLAATASIGLALGDEHSDPAQLLREADAAMYAAKDNGRNRIERFTAALHEQAQRRLTTTARLRDALDEDRLVVHYQPTIELATGRIVGVEALARLALPDGSLLSPGEFIPVAEDTGLIGQLGHHVLEIACRDALAWVAADPEFTVSVNLSPRQFTDPRLPETIAGTLERAGLAPANLWLEITESVLLSGPHVLAAIRSLRLTGVRLAIDDFGTGYSSLSHLRDTPVDALKIDRSFVANSNDSERDRALIVAALDLARTFELTTIAEGIEADHQRRLLTRLGCDYAQGFHWSPPVPAADISGMLATTGEDGVPG